MIKLDNISKRFFVRLKGDKSLFLTVLNRKKKSILALNNIFLSNSFTNLFSSIDTR